MHSVSSVQCKQVCFSGGHFANPVMSRLTEWRLYRAPIGPPMTRNCSHRWPCGVVWPQCGYFGGFSCSKQCCMVVWVPSHPSHLPHPSPSSQLSNPLLCWTEISAHQINRHKSPKIQPSAFHKINYTKSNGLLCLLLLIHDGQLQAAGYYIF